MFHVIFKILMNFSEWWSRRQMRQINNPTWGTPSRSSTGTTTDTSIWRNSNRSPCHQILFSSFIWSIFYVLNKHAHTHSFFLDRYVVVDIQFTKIMKNAFNFSRKIRCLFCVCLEYKVLKTMLKCNQAVWTKFQCQ